MSPVAGRNLRVPESRPDLVHAAQEGLTILHASHEEGVPQGVELVPTVVQDPREPSVESLGLEGEAIVSALLINPAVTESFINDDSLTSWEKVVLLTLSAQ